MEENPEELKALKTLLEFNSQSELTFEGLKKFLQNSKENADTSNESKVKLTLGVPTTRTCIFWYLKR